jgi:hypothetical protein
MKLKFYTSLLVLSALSFSNTARAFTSLVIITKPAVSAIKTPDPLSLITARQFISLSPKKFEELTGKKMNLVKRIEFKMLQHKVKKMVRKGEVITMADVKKEFDDLSSMNVLGFLLGLILGPVGVVIALILKETGDVSSDVVRWSLYGLLVWLAIVLVVILL